MDAGDDSDRPTVHLRCGSDIFRALREAGFTGDFVEHSYPYAHGPVQDGPSALPGRARFIVEAHPALGLGYAEVLRRLSDDERALAATATGYDRVVVWSEHDRWDLLMLVRVLAQYARGPMPRALELELVLVDRYPGVEPFRGLGQLRPAQLRALWPTRRPVTPAQLELGREAWDALASADPRALAALAATGTPALPLLAPALRRHLAELPGVGHGLSRTQWLLLSRVASGPATVEELFGWINGGGDDLPGLTDLTLLATLEGLEGPPDPALRREPGEGPRRPWTDRISATPFGARLLGGGADWMETAPSSRWVGGVRIGGSAPGHGGAPAFRWDAASGTVVTTGT
jgi:hypothetical protein